VTTNDHPDESVSSPAPDMQRYSRQILYEKIGARGQRKLLTSRVLLVGCGALGSAIADSLVRAGVGMLRICDRDFIEKDNLQRQVLFDERDIEANLPKAEAAAIKLRYINSEVTVESVVVDVNHTSIERLAGDVDLLLDGTDNFEARYLLNDFAVSTGKPWIYGAVIGTSGLVMPVIPHETPCLRCVFDEAPPAELNPTCDTAGVLGPAVMLVAGLQSIEAMKLLSGRASERAPGLLHVDAWSGRVVCMNVQGAYEDGDCVCCKHGDFVYLRGERGGSAAELCGRHAVQILGDVGKRVDLSAMAGKLEGAAGAQVRVNRFMLRFAIDPYELTLFPDGRAIIKGTDDADRARSLYAKYFGA